MARRAEKESFGKSGASEVQDGHCVAKNCIAKKRGWIVVVDEITVQQRPVTQSMSSGAFLLPDIHC